MFRKKILILLILVFFVLFLGCDSYEKKYIESNMIEFPDRGTTSVDFSKYYNDIVKDYYELSNVNKTEMYRYKDSAVIVFDFSNKVSYEEIRRSEQFFVKLFIEGHGKNTISVGKMSGFFKKVYDDNYNFWNDAFLVCKINDKIVYQLHYVMNDSSHLVFEKEYIDLKSKLFELNKSNLKRFTNLKELEAIGDCSYYRNVIGNTLYIDIYKNESMSSSSFKDVRESIKKIITNIDDELFHYYSGSYTKIKILIRDNVGVYCEDSYILDLKHGFKNIK